MNHLVSICIQMPPITPEETQTSTEVVSTVVGIDFGGIALKVV